MSKKTTKRSLLASVLALALCVVMLVGTTFAWFTDTAGTSVNKIQAGKLKVDIVGADSTEHVERLNFTKAAEAEGEDILWEPGCRYLTEGFRIANKGNLALKWKAQVNKGTTAANEGNYDLLDVIDFYLVTGTGENQTETLLDEFTGNLTKEQTSGVYYIKGVMQTTAGNEYQGLSLDGITITVYAAQDTVESDSFNSQYDADAPLDFVQVSSTEELKAAFASVKAGEDVNVALNGDVAFSEQTLMIADQITPNVGDIYIQGNGHTITNTVDNARCVQLANFTSDRKITISGAKIVSESTATNNSERRGVQIFSVNNATINLVNCDIEMKSTDYSYPIKIGGTSTGLTVNITGCTLTGANCIDSYGIDCVVNITDCVFNSNYAPNATYCGNGIQDKNGTNNTYNIKNTTFNGTNAQPWQTSETTTINDLGGNVFNTTRTTA